MARFLLLSAQDAGPYYRLFASKRGYSNGVPDKRPVVVAFTGDLDFTVRDMVRARLAELADAEAAVIDLTQVDYMDSLALAELVALHRTRERAGLPPPRVVIGERIARLYEISGLGTIVPAYHTLAEAQAD